MSDFTPTAEQQDCLRQFSTGDDLAIEAGAGAGKTSTLKLLAESCPTRTGQYVAFNKAIVEEAGRSFPKNVTCSTIHSLAFRSVGKGYAARLRNSRRMRSNDLARFLRVDPIELRYGTERKRLAPGFLAGQVMRALENFCSSADAEPTVRHFGYIDGIDVPTPTGDRTFGNNDEIAAALEPALLRAWADAQNPTGQLPYKHSWYLKVWERSAPTILAEFLLVDEAQDISPVMASVIFQQRGRTQLVFVGDSAQSIYGFTGAINALGRIREQGVATAWLTESFRFGPAIADVANGLLARAGHELRIKGAARHASVVAATPDPRCVLTRTNAMAVRMVLEAMEQGRKAALMGGGDEVRRFAEGARDLQAGGWTSHPDLACFSDWNQVVSYVSDDPQGDDLRLLVKLIDEFGAQEIIDALTRTVREADADVVVSTAHKSKGCEWDSVQIAADFVPGKDGAESSVEELRLMYVAATRARRELDVTAVPHFLAPQPRTPRPVPAADVPGEAPVGPQEARDGCPLCGRTDVIRGGLIGAHRCATAEVAP